MAPANLSLSVLAEEDLPELPDRYLEPAEIRAWVDRLAERRDLWEPLLDFDRPDGRHYVSLHRDAFLDVWLLCWNTDDDTGWHDHDTSSGAVVVTQGVVEESWPRLGAEPRTRHLSAGESISFGPDYIHRMTGGVDASVSIHAYSPPLWRLGQYSVTPDGVLRRISVSYADELRPIGQ